MKIDGDICLLARGLAIFSVVVHNFVHLIPGRYVTENEMMFSVGNPAKLYANICALKSSVVGDVLSFFGWYGVAVFVFLSGYGLAVKYETSARDDYVWWRHLVHALGKMIVLVAPPYLLYLVFACTLGDHQLSVPWREIPILANFHYPFCFTDPGVYWYVGLAIQLYAVYGLFHRFRGLMVAGVSAGISLMAMIWVNPTLADSFEPLKYLRANFISWLPVFVAGILLARMEPLNPAMRRRLSNPELVLGLVVSTLLLWVLSCEYHVWIVSWLPAVLLTFFLACLVSRTQIRWVRNFVAFLGRHSASIFVIHPVVRLFFSWHPPKEGMATLSWTLSGVLISIVAAYGYSLCLNRVFHRYGISSVWYFINRVFRR